MLGQPGDPKVAPPSAFVHKMTKLRSVVRRLAIYAGVLACVLLAGVVLAAPVLHEYFDVNSADVAPAVEGAAAPTPAPPSPHAQTASAANNAAKSDGPHASSDPSRYQLDANTSRPDRVGYEDPFTPSIPPFKRLVAYDSVNEGLELVVLDPRLNQVEIGGSPHSRDDQFFGDISVDVADGKPIRVPSVGPMARVIGAKVDPPGQFALLEDSAENWFLKVSGTGNRRLTVHLAIDRAVFGSPFADTTWERLAGYLPDLPAAVGAAAAPVLKELGLSRAQSPAAALERMVQHFRSFAPSDERRMETGVELYTEIALGQAGVCRHRSFAFVVTALALGLPTRFVHNEAHAWVEVFDAKLWHRIDLGGAAGDVSFDNALDVPHVAPPDPHAWPTNSESGQDMVNEAVLAAEPRANPSGAGGGTGPVGTSASPGAQGSSEPPTGPTVDELDSEAQPAEPSSTAEEALEPPDPATASVQRGVFADVKLMVAQQAAVRGARVAVVGRIAEVSGSCPLRKVRVLLRSSDGNVQALGVLVADERGHFEGQLVVPNNVPVGDYDLYVTSPAEGECRPVNSLETAP